MFACHCSWVKEIEFVFLLMVGSEMVVGRGVGRGCWVVLLLLLLCCQCQRRRVGPASRASSMEEKLSVLRGIIVVGWLGCFLKRTLPTERECQSAGEGLTGKKTMEERMGRKGKGERGRREKRGGEKWERLQQPKGGAISCIPLERKFSFWFFRFQGFVGCVYFSLIQL